MVKKRWLVGVAALMVLALTACGSVLPLRATVSAEGPAAGESAEAVAPVAVAPALESAGGGSVVSADAVPAAGVIVVGTGTASAEPEIAQLVFGVELRGDDPAALVDEAARKMDLVLAAAGEQGVADEDLQTTGYNLWVETIYDPDTGTPTGEVVYHVSHFVQATLRDPAKVGNLLAAVVEAGANNISSVNFTVEDPKALMDEARQKAVDDAEARAEAIAKALGIELGSVIRVSEVTGTVIPLDRFGLGGGAAAEVAAPSITPGAFSVSVSVELVYAIP